MPDIKFGTIICAGGTLSGVDLARKIFDKMGITDFSAGSPVGAFEFIGRGIVTNSAKTGDLYDPAVFNSVGFPDGTNLQITVKDGKIIAGHGGDGGSGEAGSAGIASDASSATTAEEPSLALYWPAAAPVYVPSGMVPEGSYGGRGGIPSSGGAEGIGGNGLDGYNGADAFHFTTIANAKVAISIQIDDGYVYGGGGGGGASSGISGGRGGDGKAYGGHGGKGGFGGGMFSATALDAAPAEFMPYPGALTSDHPPKTSSETIKGLLPDNIRDLVVMSKSNIDGGIKSVKSVKADTILGQGKPGGRGGAGGKGAAGGGGGGGSGGSGGSGGYPFGKGGSGAIGGVGGSSTDFSDAGQNGQDGYDGDNAIVDLERFLNAKPVTLSVYGGNGGNGADHGDSGLTGLAGTNSGLSFPSEGEPGAEAPIINGDPGKINMVAEIVLGIGGPPGECGHRGVARLLKSGYGAVGVSGRGGDAGYAVFSGGACVTVNMCDEVNDRLLGAII